MKGKALIKFISLSFLYVLYFKVILLGIACFIYCLYYLLELKFVFDHFCSKNPGNFNTCKLLHTTTALFKLSRLGLLSMKSIY